MVSFARPPSSVLPASPPIPTMRLPKDIPIECGGNYTEHASEVFLAAGNFSEIFLKAIMSSGPNHLYEFGPFVLNPAERTLIRDGSRVPLRPKVFDTLLVLIENGGHLVEKDELMKAVWPDQFVEEGNLNKTVSKAGARRRPDPAPLHRDCAEARFSIHRRRSAGEWRRPLRRDV
jgi:hypothetical protein